MRAWMLAAIVVVGTVLVTGSILATSLVGPSRSASANCSSCHGSLYYLSVEITDLTTPASLDLDGSGQATVSVKVSADGTNSRYIFTMTARIVSENSMIQVSSQQTDTGRSPTGSSEPYTWTKTYTFTLTGKVAGTETLRAEAVMDPSHESPAVKETRTKNVEVRSVNRAPSLTLGGVYPGSGDTDTPFTYSVRYSDPDGDAPDHVRVVIDGTDTRDLTLADGTGDSYVAGEAFSLHGVTLGEGDHEFHFVASDGELSARFPTGTSVGPGVVKANSAPVLSEPLVDPENGGPGDNFTFRVTYTDLDGDAPTVVELILDGDPFVMGTDTDATAYLRDGSFDNGERFVKVLPLSEGIHEHSFSTTDGEKGTVLGPFDGPAVSSVPVLSVSITEPVSGIYLAGTEIGFSCSSLTNVQDAVVDLRWTSNVSGEISNEREFTFILPVGHHLITVEASIVTSNLSAEASVIVEVSEETPPPPPFNVLGVDPTGNVEMNETDWVLFSVDVEIVAGPGPVLIWEYDDAEIKTGADLNLTTDYASSGNHTLVLLIMHMGEEHSRFIWYVNVTDVPAPIVVTDDGWSVAQRFSIGDRIDISLPLEDPLGRELTVRWTIDGIPLDGGLELSLLAGERPFADPGVHEVLAIARNPDSTSHSIEFSFRVTGVPDSGDPPTVEERAEGSKMGPLGIFILSAGTLSLLGGSVYLVAVMLPERKPYMKRMDGVDE